RLFNLGAVARGLIRGVSARYRYQSGAAEGEAAARLLRDLFGASFPLPTLDPVWLRWNDALVPRLAHTIYQDRAFDLPPILRHPLEDAECSNQELLDHCRAPGEHARGCWLLDLLLGKV